MNRREKSKEQKEVKRVIDELIDQGEIDSLVVVATMGKDVVYINHTQNSMTGVMGMLEVAKSVTYDKWEDERQ